METQITDLTADPVDLDFVKLMSRALSIKADISALIEPFDYYYGHLFRPYTEVLEPNLKEEIENLREALFTIERIYHLLEARKLLHGSDETQSEPTLNPDNNGTAATGNN